MSIEEENIENASQAETGSELRIRLEELPGVGSIRGAKLAKLGLVTVRDALMHFHETIAISLESIASMNWLKASMHL